MKSSTASDDCEPLQLAAVAGREVRKAREIYLEEHKDIVYAEARALDARVAAQHGEYNYHRPPEAEQAVRQAYRAAAERLIEIMDAYDRER